MAVSFFLVSVQQFRRAFLGRERHCRVLFCVVVDGWGRSRSRGQFHHPIRFILPVTLNKDTTRCRFPKINRAVVKFVFTVLDALRQRNRVFYLIFEKESEKRSPLTPLNKGGARGYFKVPLL